MGYVGFLDPWVCGSNFYVGSVGFVGQIFTWVAWATWVKILFTWVIIFTWVTWVKYVFAWVNFFWVGPNFLRGSKSFGLVNFYLLDEIILLYCN